MDFVRCTLRELFSARRVEPHPRLGQVYLWNGLVKRCCHACSNGVRCSCKRANSSLLDKREAKEIQ
eukprot:1254425-Pyramimonas_sp.AAC.1